MRQHPVERGRRFVAKVHVGMALLAALAAALSAWHSWQAAAAVFSGAMAVLLPQAYIAKRLLKPFGPNGAAEFTFALWLMQGLKWMMTMVLLGLAFYHFRQQALFVFIGFVVIFQGLWILPWFLSRKGLQ